MTRCDDLPPLVRERYDALRARYRDRGWAVQPLPDAGYAAQNLIWEMAARLNGREPIHVALATEPLIVRAVDDA